MLAGVDDQRGNKKDHVKLSDHLAIFVAVIFI